jgi:hypothetical protein
MRKTYLEDDIKTLLRAKIGKGENQTTQRQWAKDNNIHPTLLSRFLNGGDGLFVVAKALGFEPVATRQFYKKDAK